MNEFKILNDYLMLVVKNNTFLKIKRGNKNG